ncbi:MAG: TPM domain-containing protein [Bryobacteraceae bacterium]
MPGRLRIILFRLCIAAWMAGFAARPALCAVDVNSLPKPTGYVSDLAHVLSPDEKAQLEGFCSKVEQQLGVQFALVTIDTLGDQPIEDFAIQLARKWGVGDRKSNQGVLLLLAIKDHKDDIETGRGIEPYLTDGFSGSILRSIRPQLRDNDYSGALLTAARGMAQQIAQGKGGAFSDDLPQPQKEPENVPNRRRGGIPGPLLVLGIFVLLWLFSRVGRGGRGGRGGFGGFLTGMLLGNLLGGGRSSGGRWGNGGGFGGSSGGGGGFGGFGGGDFGGGGANSNW